MELPQSLRKALENALTGTQTDRMLQDALAISLRYRNNSGKGERLLTRESEALAYAAARMPATFAAVYDALRHTLANVCCRPQTLLDAGAGTGAATWAAHAQLDLSQVLCLEREDAMRRVGQRLMAEAPPVLSQAQWVAQDLMQGPIPKQADLVLASYVLNEMTHMDRMAVAQKLWDASRMLCILIEPGTPQGFAHLLAVRKCLLEQGAYLVAPCPHAFACPKSAEDWCHFTTRVGRTRVHRRLKRGEAPFEDEKYIYMAFTREKSAHEKQGRVLRHPQIRSGHVMLEVCTPEGIRQMKYAKKDGEKYKQARKANTGDTLEVFSSSIMS